MARRYYSSVAVATALAADVNNVDTSIQVSSLNGFPAQAPFTIIVDQDQATEEVMEVTNVASLVLTVARGIDGTSAVAHTTGAIVRHGVSARDFDEANSHVNNATTDVHSQYVLKSTATTAGDLLVRDASTVTRLPVGGSGQVLTVDESVPAKVKWATPSSTSPSDVIPAGVIMPYAGTSAPLGWLLCDGSQVSQLAYPQLYALVGSTFGTAAGGQFFLPDLRGRTVFGFTSSDANFNARGKTGGTTSVSLSTSNMPGHTHSTPNHTHTATVSALTASSAGDHGHTVTSSSTETGSHQHSYLQMGYARVDLAAGSQIPILFDPDYSENSGSNTTGSAGSHSHTISSSATTSGSHTHSISGSVTINSGGAGTSGSTGSGTAFNNLNPYMALNYIIKAS